MSQKIQHISTDEKQLREDLIRALTAQLMHERHKCGLSLTDEEVSYVGQFLLTKDEKETIHKWYVREDVLYDSYRKEDHEILDYLHLIPHELRKKLGQFITPSIIVRCILSSVDYLPTQEILRKKIIDPACGSGIFLVEALRIYLKALQFSNIPVDEWYEYVTQYFVGLDVDSKACLFSRFNIALLLGPSVLRCVSVKGPTALRPIPIYNADTIRLLTQEFPQTKLFYNKQYPIRLRENFDFVVGNPPYHKIPGLSQDLKLAFKESLYGHPNAYGIFIHAGIEMLNNNGSLGYIIPRSILSGLYFKNLRSFIEKRTRIKEIVHISNRKKIFDNVLQGTMILALSKKSNKKRVRISFTKSLDDFRATIKDPLKISQVKIARNLNGTSVWFLSDSKRTYDIIDKILADHPILSDATINCPAKTGQIVWNRVKNLLCENSTEGAFPLIWATDVSRFNFSFHASGDKRPAYLKITPKTNHLIVRGKCILIQRVTADEQPCRIVACLPEKFCEANPKGFFVENHLNFIQLGKESKITDLYYLLGILNSDVIEFFFRIMSGNTQVSATELNLLPIPIRKHNAEVASLARSLQKRVETPKFVKHLQELNHLIAKCYGLCSEDFQYIQKALNDIRGRNNNT